VCTSYPGTASGPSCLSATLCACDISSFHQSVTVGSSETEHRDRGTKRESKHRTDCTEKLHMEDTPQSRMSDHTDGSGAAAACKKRMLEGHPGGPQGKHDKHEERDVNPANASDLAAAPAPHPAAAKKPRKAPSLCEHQRVRSRCKQCGGSGICEHQRQRSQCKDCGGNASASTSGCGAGAKTEVAAQSASTS